MPKSSKAKLAYQKAYNARPENIDKRVKNNAARRDAIASGKAKVGDNTQVDHKKPLDKGGTNDKNNLRVVDRKVNAGWRKDHPDMYGKK